MYISPHILPHLQKVQTLLNELDPQADAQALKVPGSPTPEGNIVVFTGSFNPPTIAHMALLKQAQNFTRVLQMQRGEAYQPFHLYAAFSKHTVNKEWVERPLLLDRVVLLQTLLRRRLPHAGILLFNRGLYLEQVEAIRASFPRVRRVFFLLGFDKIEQIFDPRYYTDRDAALDALFRQAELLVAPRGRTYEHEKGVLPLQKLLDQPQNRRFAQFVHPLPFDPLYKEISSTHVRQNDAASAHEVPQEVRQFIKETRAYAPPVRQADGSLVDIYVTRVNALNQLLGMTVS